MKIDHHTYNRLMELQRSVIKEAEAYDSTSTYRLPSNDAQLNRTSNALWRYNISTIEHIERLTDDDLLLFRNVGPKGVARLRAAIAEYRKEHPCHP